MNILIIGVGYVGLVTGTCFAEVGHRVICLDVDKNKIDDLNHGKIPIYEPGLTEMVERNVQSGRLSFTTEYGHAIKNSKYIFIAVNTPTSSSGEANIDTVLKVASTIGDQIEEEKVIITKSTVPPGTSYQVRQTIKKSLKRRKKEKTPFFLCNNPEFLKEGSAIADFMKPDRVICGVDDFNIAEEMQNIYAPFMLNHDRFLVMDILSSEMTKYVANAMLATRISFMNEMARIAETVGADIHKVRLGIASDKRIGHSFLYPGTGYGGSCLPKDVLALKSQATKKGCNTPLLDAVDNVNNNQKQLLCEKIIKAFGEDLEGITFGIWGLSFKPYTDDMREAPSLVLIHELIKRGAKLQLYDPIAMKNAAKSIADHPLIQFVDSEEKAANSANALVLMTEWKQFRLQNLEKILETMQGNYFFDGRNQYEPEAMAKKGFIYYSVGRPSIPIRERRKKKQRSEKFSYPKKNDK